MILNYSVLFFLFFLDINHNRGDYWFEWDKMGNFGIRGLLC